MPVVPKHVCFWLVVVTLGLASPAGAARDVDLPPNEPLTDAQRQLLAVAMDAASKMPLDPHIKNRSRAQHQVVQAYLELDQPRRAWSATRRIAKKSWRRGASAAELAHSLAKEGHTESVDRLLKLAEAASLLVDRAWRKEYIAMYIARARLAMGQADAARNFRAQHKTDTFRGRLASSVAKSSDSSYDAMDKRLEPLLEGKQHDAIRNAATGYTALYRRHYDNKERRQAIERKLRDAYAKLGEVDRLELELMLAKAALANDDAKRAASFLDVGAELFQSISWPTNRPYAYQYAARLAKLRHRAGDTAAARKRLDLAAERFDQRRSSISNLRHADCLRPLAAAYQTIGATKAAAAHYERAVKLGAVNKNGRPRAVDLAKTCTSMARVRFAPDAALWRRIRTTLDQLSAPW